MYLLNLIRTNYKRLRGIKAIAKMDMANNKSGWWLTTDGKFTKFLLVESECPCCKQNFMQQKLIDKIQELREKLDMPIIITSGFRCEKHNKKVEGKPKSKHLEGLAVDCNIYTNLETVKKKAIEIGFTGIGLGKTFIHLDVRNSENVVEWVYA